MSFITNKKFLQVSNIITFVLTIFMNFLSSALPLGGITQGEISDRYSNLFAPSGLTFSIWFFIYLFLGFFIIYTSRDLWKEQEADIPYIEQVSFYFILSNGLNIGWLFAWHFDVIPLTLVLMVAILLTLIRIYTRLNIGLEDISTREKMLVHVPFSLYLGWISIATIANFAVFFIAIGWNGFGISEPIWTIIVLLIALILTLLIQYTRKDIAFSIVVVWALLGIIIKRLNPISLNTLLLNLCTLFEPIYYEIIIVSIIAEIITGIGIAVIIIRILK